MKLAVIPVFHLKEGLMKKKSGVKPLSGDRNKPSYTLSIRITFSSELIYNWVKNKTNKSEFFRNLCEHAYLKERDK